MRPRSSSTRRAAFPGSRRTPAAAGKVDVEGADLAGGIDLERQHPRQGKPEITEYGQVGMQLGYPVRGDLLEPERDRRTLNPRIERRLKSGLLHRIAHAERERTVGTDGARGPPQPEIDLRHLPAPARDLVHDRGNGPAHPDLRDGVEAGPVIPAQPLLQVDPAVTSPAAHQETPIPVAGVHELDADSDEVDAGRGDAPLQERGAAERDFQCRRIDQRLVLRIEDPGPDDLDQQVVPGAVPGEPDRIHLHTVAACGPGQPPLHDRRQEGEIDGSLAHPPGDEGRCDKDARSYRGQEAQYPTSGVRHVPLRLTRRCHDRSIAPMPDTKIAHPALPSDPARAARGAEDWEAAVGPLDRDTPCGAAVHAALGSSPFLSESLLRFPDFARRVVDEGPTPQSVPCSTNWPRSIPPRTLPPSCVPSAASAPALPPASRSPTFPDAGSWKRITGALSRFAAGAVDCAVRHLLATGREFSGAETEGIGPDRAPAWASWGPGSSNYSSDADLILLFDDSLLPVRRADRTGQTMARFTRDLVRLLQERTPDGYVLRIDLRLRPDPASTPLAVPLRAAEAYYESMGQNWERAAMLKARPIAGDIAAGDGFLTYIRPFIWRRSLDFWAINDIHSIKRQTHAHRGHDRIAVAGHNVKLGRGGIREIEFYTQTQQLIWGGRDTSPAGPGHLRRPLRRWSAPATCRLRPRTALRDAYRFLRTIEHRIQMIDDRQTHSLPDAGRLDGFARFAGFEDADGFRACLSDRLNTVSDHYGRLFEGADSLAAQGSLVFTGTEDDPDTVETLSGLGYGDPGRAIGIVRAWHSGSIRATRSLRARELLTELVPALIAAFAGTSRPDRALVDFDRFLTRLPAGIPVFALCHARPELLDLIAEVLGDAPLLAEHMTKHPNVLEGMLADVADDPREGLAAALRTCGDFQDILDATRRWANDMRFALGLELLRGTLPPDETARRFTAVADACVGALLDATRAEFEEAHGGFPDGGFALLAYGKWGSSDLTLGSDLDMAAVYGVPGDTTHSDGARPLWASTYHSRLVQRLQTAVTSQTGEGSLFKVDLRLRPSGNDGPLASEVDGFERYHREDAWTWEHMALVRMRAAVGTPGLRERLERFRMEILSRPHPDLRREIGGMRVRMAEAHGRPAPLDMKHRPGGLIDIEFLAQYLVLSRAASDPGIAARAAAAVFRAAGREWLPLADIAERFYAIQALVRLCGDASPEHTPALARLIAGVYDCEDFAVARARIESDAEAARAAFEQHLTEGKDA